MTNKRQSVCVAKPSVRRVIIVTFELERVPSGCKNGRLRHVVILTEDIISTVVNVGIIIVTTKIIVTRLMVYV